MVVLLKNSRLTHGLARWKKTEFSWTPAIQAVSESRIFEQDYPFLRYTSNSKNNLIPTHLSESRGFKIYFLVGMMDFKNTGNYKAHVYLTTKMFKQSWVTDFIKSS